MPSDGDRLRRTLGSSEAAPLLDALARRVVRERPLSGTITLRSLSADEGEAISSLLGKSFAEGNAVRVDLDALGDRLRAAGISADLTEAVIALRGPILSHRAQAESLAQSWAPVRALAETAVAGRPEVAGWIRHLIELGVVRRLAGGAPATAELLLRQLSRLAEALPAQADPLPALAARLFGSAHALDPGSPLATLGVRLAARIGNIRYEESAEGRRTAWAAAGVLCDELSLPVLVFNLCPQGESVLCRLLAAAAAGGEPLHLSTRLLMGSPFDAQSGLRDRDIFVCENPAIVGLAARRLSRNCAPLVCVNGQFATAALLLLRMLRGAGARLRVHADFDAGGLRIAQRVMVEGAAIPWRYGAADYASAPKGVSLSADLPPTPWEPGLRDAMLREARVVHEEALAKDLLHDLNQRPPT